MIILIDCDLEYVLLGSGYDIEIIVIIVLCNVWTLIDYNCLTWGHDDA